MEHLFQKYINTSWLDVTVGNCLHSAFHHTKGLVSASAIGNSRYEVISLLICCSCVIGVDSILSFFKFKSVFTVLLVHVCCSSTTGSRLVLLLKQVDRHSSVINDIVLSLFSRYLVLKRGSRNKQISSFFKNFW